MPRELKGWARPRPLRVAFLIEDGEHSSLALDGIFADCYSRWGGRFSLIAPCVNGRIAPSYWPWLEAYDPDIVYSYVPLTKADVQAFREKWNTFLTRARDAIKNGIAKDQLLAQIKTDDLGWTPRIPQVDPFYDELSKAK